MNAGLIDSNLISRNDQVRGALLSLAATAARQENTDAALQQLGEAIHGACRGPDVPVGERPTSVADAIEALATL